MEKLIAIQDIQVVNSAESTFGDMAIFGNILVIPFYNVKINPGHSNSVVQNEAGKYIKYSYLVFENFSGITRDYELSRHMKGDLNSGIRECYGGIYYFDHEDYEFWIEYKNGYIVLPEDVISSPDPFFIIDSEASFFKGDLTNVRASIHKQGNF